MHFKAFGNPVPAGGGLLTKTLLVMKLTTILIFIACLHVSATGLSQRVTLTMKDAPLVKVFDEISRQAGVSIVYKEDLLAKARPVSISVKDAPVEEVLAKCLKGQPFSFHIENDMIVIQAPPAPVPDLPQVASAPPPIDVHGRVMDSLGKPLAGASITISGAKKAATLTDEKGNFVLIGIDPGQWITVSYAGFEPKRIRIQDRSSIEVALSRSNSVLDQVQVIAYGTTTRRYSTGDITTVTGKDI